MSEKIVVPALGESITEATVAKWLKNTGDSIEADEPIVELETDKVNLEVPSPINGVLGKISASEGDVVQVGSTLGLINSNSKGHSGNNLKDKSEDKEENNNLIKVAALLIHAAKIDENYSNKEEEIIKKALLKIGANDENVKNILQAGKTMEDNTNQILDFTREVKNMNENDKIKIIETLWQIIYSNNEADIYETNLMRRLAGLLYIDSKTMGDIKNKVKKNL